MRKKRLAALASIVLAAGLVLPGTASASAPTSPDNGNRHCQAGFDAAVHEDNNAYNARDVARYTAILNPRMIFWYDGVTTYGRDAIIETAKQNFAVPGWIWTYDILSETVYGCDSGIAVLDTHTLYPAHERPDHHFAVTMTLVREHGKWSVAIDNVHLLPS
jgi:hypothetical protein